MKTVKLFLIPFVAFFMLSSCYTEVIVEDEYVDTTPTLTLRQLLSSYELWYVDINQSSGNGYIPFVQKAFTLSFRNGTVHANNNLVGIGDQGYGFGIDVGYYDAYEDVLEISHDIDGFHRFIVTQLNDTTIELYYPPKKLRYILVGYQRSTFDYDKLFYENLHYFLQEYVAWEKIYTSEYGALNEFDYENFLQFLPAQGDGNFRSSRDGNGTNIDYLYWDYSGIYEVDDIDGEHYLKHLTLDYDYLGNEYFELYVMNDNTIELFHNTSGTLYRFRGRGFIQYKNNEGKLRKSNAEVAKEIENLIKA